MNNDTPAEQTTETVSETPLENNAASEPDVEPVVEPEKTKPVRASRSGRWATPLALLALLITLGLSAVGYYFWHQLHETGTLRAQQLEQTESRLAALQSSTQQLRTEISSEFEERIRALQATQQDLRDTVQALNAQVRQKIGVSTALAEAEFLVRSANNHLQFDRDTGTAIAALTAADERLRAAGDPDVLKVRGLLASEINALSALAQTDTPGLALSLNSLINSVDQLPLKAQSSNPPVAKDQPKAEDWRALLSNIWASLKSLVVVRYDNKTAEPLIAPEQSYFLYQNLRLQLETARLALLRRDSATFRATLNTARAWLNTYFDANAPATKHTLETVARLSETEINPALPEISASLKALIELMEDKTATVSVISPVISSDTTSDSTAQDDATASTPAAENNGATEETSQPENNSGMLQP